MAQSLGLAWKDLNELLEHRKQVLERNFLFQGHFQVGLIKTHLLISNT